MKLKKIVAAVSASAILMSAFSIQAFAYGEVSSPTIIGATQSLADYQNWRDTVWTAGPSTDSAKIALTPGKTEKDLNFAWYSLTAGTPAVKISTHSDMSGGVVYNGTATTINRSNGTNTYTASNKVSISGAFNENTTYYYTYTDDVSVATPVWSTPEQYITKGSTGFQALLVGDPQTGASGNTAENIATDTYNWNKTTMQMAATAPNASFIVSVGDQINYANEDSADTTGRRESEYAGFLYPDLLRNMPLATAIGNHESKGTDYSNHFNNPNIGDNLGATTSGSDYYFSYGDVLFISLNSNNRNSAEHEELMEKAIASHSDAKWKVVFFHHDIYGSGAPHSDTDAANLRTIFAPLMDEFDIDICLTGHDHAYARSYQMIDGTAINYGSSQAVNPEGTLYITAGSASGSKFYDLASTKQYYVAERTNAALPSFSTIDFSGNSLVIKTYDYNGNKYADDFTITKNADKESLVNLFSQINGLNAADYTSDSWTKLQQNVASIANLLQLTGEDTGAATLSSVYDETLNTDNAADPLNYYGYAQGTYQDSIETERLVAGFSTLLDKTISDSLLISSVDYENAYSLLYTAVQNLESVNSVDTPTTQENKNVQNLTASVKTGDTSNIVLLIGLLSASALAGGAVVFKRKKKVLNNN